MSQGLSRLSTALLMIAIVLSTFSGLPVQHVQAVPGAGVANDVSQVTSVDLSRYVRVGRFDLPEPTRTTPPPNNLLGQEASGVAYNWDTNTLFITGDGGTSVTQVTKTGQLIDTMTLGPGPSPQGTDFYDPEGITYIGGGKFVLVEERDRQASLFTYVAGGTLRKADVQTVKLGTTIGNIGLEGLSFDPLTSGYIFVKEADPISIFQTGIDFVAKTATNGSPTATGSTDLFNPALANLADFSDVFALSNLPSLNGQPDFSHLLVLSQESGQVINVDRSGNVSSRLTIVADPGNPLPVAEQTHEGLTMDRDGNLYIVSENGGGDSDHPQLWVYAPSTAPNQAPTAITLNNAVTSIPENTNTAAPVKLADVVVTDDGLGRNDLTVTGADAGFFQIIGTALYLKAGTALSSSAKPTYSIAVNVDDTAVGNTPDATRNFNLIVTTATGGIASLIISEVAPWSSGNSAPSLRVDWFEVTNIGTATANIAGWRVDDDSNSFNNALELNGITNIAPGESVIFMETNDLAGKSAAFKTLWFGANAPANLQIGSYTGAGIGLSTGGDQVNLFDSAGAVRANVAFGASPTGPSFPTFDNGIGLNNATISLLSAVGINGAFAAANDAAEIGSPGAIGASSSPIVNITAPDANASEAGDDTGTFRITRTGSTVGPLIVSYTIATGSGQATSPDYTPTLTGAALIPAAQSFVEITITPVNDNVVEGNETVTLTLGDTGSYDVGANGTATVTIADTQSLGSSSLVITEVAPWSSGNSAASLRVDWFEVTNSGNTNTGIAGWKVDDDSRSFANAVTLSGITNIAPGESVIFMETTDLATKSAAFKALWFGATPPPNLQIGSYSGAGIGLSTGGDQLNLFDSAGTLRSNIVFGASPVGPFPTFDNTAGLNNATISSLSAVGVNGAFAAANDGAEIGSPGTSGVASLIVSEVAPWSSGNSAPSLRVDWFEVTNIGTATANITGWRVDDDSRAFNTALALNGITYIAPGESVIFMETTDLAGKSAAFKTLWFGANAPPNLQLGSYSGGGIGFGTGGDQVNLFDSAGVMRASVTFGASPTGPFPTFDNAAGLNNTTISLLSVVGVNGAFAAANDAVETGSPGTIGAVPTPLVNITAPDANAAEVGSDPGTFRITRPASTSSALTVTYTIATGSGQATSADYTPTLTGAATILAGQPFVEIIVTPIKDNLVEGNEAITLTLVEADNYNVGASNTAIVTITDALTQTITFNQPADKTFGDAPFTLSATASSGLPVSFAASGTCTVQGAVVTLTGAGSCTITASQAGDASYSPAPDVSRTFSIARGDTTTTILTDAPDPSVVDEQVTVQYRVSANAPGGSTPTGLVTVTDGVDACTGSVAAGSCVITLSTVGARTLRAIYAGDANFNPSTSADETHQVLIEIDSVYPNSADPGGRITMTVIGKGFVPQSKISIEGLGLTVFTRYVSSTRLTAIVIVSASAFTTVRDVTVTNPDGNASTKAGAFTVR